MRGGKALLGLAAVLALLTTGHLAAAELPPVELPPADVPPTDWPNGYRHPMNRSHPPRSFVPPRILFTHSRAVYRLPDGLNGLATIDHGLSRLCQRGAFTQVSDGYYWAVSPGRSYGVAFSGGGNLDDPQKKALAGKVYFFHGQDSRCTVYVGDQAKLAPNYIGS